MKALPDVTLVAQDGKDIERTRRVVEHCRRMFDFAEVHMYCEPFTYAQAMVWEVADLVRLVKTSHCLFVSHDGWILNSHLWDDSWLEYDMIGAPWPASWGTGQRVGNTGFSLRSRRFLQASASAIGLYAGQPGDVFQCRTLHRPMVEMGMRYAPVEVARKFSWEHYIEEGECGPGCSFGFHGWVAGKTAEEFNKLLT